LAIEEPLVTIGLPVYNGERQVRGALECLLAQEYENLELLISDNASTDSTAAICEEYARKDSRIRLSFNEQNIGIVANFERVLNQATGPYFMWAAHDDLWHKDFLRSLVTELERNRGASVAMSAVERLYESGGSDVMRYLDTQNPNEMSPFRLAMALALGSPHHLFFYGLFRTDFLRRAFKNSPRVIANDRLLMIQIAMSTGFRYVDQVLHSRVINNQPIAVRYKDEEYGKVWRDPKAYLKKDLMLGPYLMQSRIIPWRRKFWIPIIVIWPPLKRLYNRVCYFLYRLTGKLLRHRGRRKSIVRYLKRLVHMNSR